MMAKAAQNHTQAQAQALAEALHAYGVDSVILSPGSRNTPLVLAFDSMKDQIEVHTILDERSAGFFALGRARASNGAVVLCCTSGSAGAHYLPAVIEAAQSNIPLIILSADRPAALHGTCAPQTVPQLDFFKPHTRWSEHIEINDLSSDGSAMSKLACQAMEIAEGAHPGPVHFNIPFEKPLWSPAYLSQDSEKQTPPVKTIEAPPLACLDAVIKTLSSTPRGVILCGHRERVPGEKPGVFARNISSLAQQLGWPIIAEPGSGLRFGKHNRKLVIDNADLLFRSERFATSLVPDQILQFGRPPLSKPTLNWLGQLSHKGKTLVPIAGEYSSSFHEAATVVQADANHVLQELSERLPAQSPNDWGTKWLEADRALKLFIQEDFESPKLFEAQIARALVHELPEGAKLFVGNSMPGRNLNTFGGGTHTDLEVWANRGANGIDGNIATLMGSASFAPKTPHIALLGDLATLHDIGSLIQLAHDATNVTLIIVDNKGGNIFKHLPISAHEEAFEKRFLTPPDVNVHDLLNRLPIAMQSISALDELPRALELACASEECQIIHISVDGNENFAYHTELVNRVRKLDEVQR